MRYSFLEIISKYIGQATRIKL